MNNIETLVVLIITSFLAIHTSLGARYNFTEIPWFSLLTCPKYFGGLNELIRNILWLFYWILVSDVFMYLCAIIIKSSELPISELYDLIDYKSDSGAKAGLATLSIMTAAMYLMLVKQTSKIVAERFSYIPREYIYPEKSILDQDQDQDQKKTTFKGKAYNLVKHIYYIAPSILAPIYAHFWKSASLVKHGCVRLLYDKYGKDNILEFYQEHSVQTPDRDIIDKINNEINNVTSKRNKAFAILSIKISNKGYHNTNGLLNNYLNSKSGSFENEKRDIKRLSVNKSLKLDSFCDGKKCNLTLIEYSRDGSSLYVLSKWPANLSNIIQIKQKNISIGCEVIHRNARKYQGKVQYGLALKVDNQEGKSNILKIVA